MSEFNWIITKCRAKFKKMRKLNYTFYIIDYCYGNIPKEINVIELRNHGLVRSKYFRTEKEIGIFLHTEGGRLTLAEANDKVFVKAIEKFVPKMIDNMLGKEVVK